MKKTALFLLLFIPATLPARPPEIQARQVILEIPDGEIKIVEQDVVDAEAWIKTAWAGKVSKCKSRILTKEIGLSMKGTEAIPAGEDAIVQKYLARPDTKTRKEVEAANAKLEEELAKANAVKAAPLAFPLAPIAMPLKVGK